MDDDVHFITVGRCVRHHDVDVGFWEGARLKVHESNLSGEGATISKLIRCHQVRDVPHQRCIISNSLVFSYSYRSQLHIPEVVHV